MSSCCEECLDHRRVTLATRAGFKFGDGDRDWRTDPSERVFGRLGGVNDDRGTLEVHDHQASLVRARR
jgi:hypothetical protein